MSVLNKIKIFLSKYKTWEYLIYLGISAIIVFLKGFLISRLLNQIEYASYSYFQLFSGLGCVIAAAGVILRCHIELPILCKQNKIDDLRLFMGQASSILLANSVLFTIGLLITILYIEGDIFIGALGAAQAFLMLIFRTELIKIKSSGDFTYYAKKLLSRNIVLLISSIIAATIFNNAKATALCETLLNSFISITLVKNYFKIAKRPLKSYLTQTIKFVPLDLIGAFAQYQDRIFAGFILSKFDFSKFSYYYIFISIGLTLQQFINTKLIVDFSTNSEIDAIKKLKNGTIFLFLASSTICIVAINLLTLTNLTPTWLYPDYHLALLTILIAGIKSADITQSYMACRKMKKNALLAQFIAMLTFLLLMYWLYSHPESDLKSFFTILAAWQAATLISGICIIQAKNWKPT